MVGDESAIDLDMGPAIESYAVANYRTIKAVLERMTRLCIMDSNSGPKPRKHEQRLLRNMGAHTAVLDLLRIPYDKVRELSSVVDCLLGYQFPVFTIAQCISALMIWPNRF